MLKHYIASSWAQNLTTYGVLLSHTTYFKKKIPHETTLGQWKSSLDNQFIWKIPSPGWRAIYVKTLYSEFLSAKFDNLSITYFLYHLNQKVFSPQTVLEQWYPSLGPHFFRVSTWPVRKAINLKHYIAIIWAPNLTTNWVLLFHATYFKKNSPSDYTRTVKILTRQSNYLKNSFTRLKSHLCWNIETLYSEL